MTVTQHLMFQFEAGQGPCMHAMQKYRVLLSGRIACENGEKHGV